MPRFALKSWNCFGAAQNLASFVRWKGAPDAHRFELSDVKDAVETIDVVCLQEVFLSDAELFFEALGHGHKLRDENRTTFWPLTFGGSGLAVASRFRISASAVRGFGRPHVGAERFARKGMLHVRLVLDEGAGGGPHEVDVITTHMQSGYYDAAGAVRIRQLKELRALCDEVGSPERAIAVCGDFNIDGLQPVREGREYAALREVFTDFDDLGAAEDHATFDPRASGNELAHRHEATSPHQRIDYVLFRPPVNPAAVLPGRGLRPVKVSLGLTEPFHCPKRGRTYASDHYAMVAEFEYE